MAERGMARKPMRWRREARARGLAGVCQGWRGFELVSDGEVIAHVAGFGDRYAPDRFYWYGLNTNTLWQKLTFGSVEEAKSHAMQSAREANPPNGGKGRG